MAMDWDHAMLKSGNGAYTCMPTPPAIRASGGRNPMCLDKVWTAWGDAWMNKKPFKAEGVGIAFMLGSVSFRAFTLVTWQAVELG
jgi:hypothetical protein